MSDDTVALQRYAWLSIATAVAVIVLKAAAYGITGSVGLLSDALESLVNLASACVALVALRVSSRPPDDDHPYGHDKAEYFSSALEGGMILVAAVVIVIAAIERLLRPRALDALGTGLAVSAIATAINLAVGAVLLRAGRRHRSIVLEADGHHLMTDVWTSVGVIVGVGAVALTGRGWLDPGIAIAVGVNIVWTGWRLVERSAHGLMDRALPEAEQAAVLAILDAHRAEGVAHHALRTREAGSRRFVELHLLVPGAWTVQRGHDLVERIEHDIRARLERATVLIHLEPAEDPASWADVGLDRRVSGPPPRSP